ncbi:MAG: glycosyltransferase [Bacilli bacterium]|nr:glycosyltransferase [Bacilli bacterium]
MSKYKISVYAISKNEEKFVDRWMDSISDADEIIVLDTGSTDKTVEKLKKRGAKVVIKEIKPWRFDVARNESLSLVSKDTDICICMDLDEVIQEGWREKLEKLWNDKINRLRYNYNWSFDEYGNPAVNFYIEKIHSRDNYKWTHPVHEVLTYEGDNEVFLTTDDITVNHYPDSSKSRGSYLPLLELSVEENPTDDRNMHYLGREYMFYGKWNEAIDTLIRHLNLPSATWKDERCASMRFIARCYTNLKRYDEARMWLDKAINESPYLRDPYVERALLEYNLKNWDEVEKYSLEALKINNHEKTYINEVFSWDHTVYDLLSLSYYFRGNNEKALEYVNRALEISPDDERLKKNKDIFEKELKKY